MLSQNYYPWPNLDDETTKALKTEELLDWSMDILPWVFRRPILKALTDHFEKKTKHEHLHRIARDVLNFSRVPIRGSLTRQRTDSLFDFFKNRNDQKLTTTTIAAFTPAGRSSKQDSPEQLDLFFRAKILLSVCKELVSHPQTSPAPEEIDSVLAIFLREFSPSNSLIPVTEARQYSVEIDAPHLRAFYFWRWQYVQRNPNYQKLQKEAELILENEKLRKSFKPLDLGEYLILPKLGALDPTRIFSESTIAIHRALNDITQRSVNKHSMWVSWPLADYGSEVILSRELSNQFRYWERPTQACNLITNHPKVPSSIMRECDDIWTEYNEVKNEYLSNEIRKVAQPDQNAVKYYNLQTKYGRKMMHQTITRMRLEVLPRALGLRLWDIIQNHNCTGFQAAEHLIAEQPSLAGKHEQAHLDRCLRTTTEAIKQAEYIPILHKLPKKRGRPRKKKTSKMRRK